MFLSCVKNIQAATVEIVVHNPASTLHFNTALEKGLTELINILVLAEKKKKALPCLHFFKPMTIILGGQDAATLPLQNDV